MPLQLDSPEADDEETDARWPSESIERRRESGEAARKNEEEIQNQMRLYHNK